MTKKFEFKKGVYCDVMNTEGIIIETLDELSKFKKVYPNLFVNYIRDEYDKKVKHHNDLYIAFKDIHVPISEGTPIIITIRNYGHWKYNNNAAWKEYKS